MNHGLRLASWFVLLVSLAGCAPSLESKLVGRWRLDTQSLDLQKAAEAQLLQQTGEQGAAGAMMNSMVSGMLQTALQSLQVEIDFRPDHTMQSRAAVSLFGQTQEKIQAGTWKVEAVGDNQLTVVVTTEDGKANTLNVKFADDNTFTATGNVPGAGDQQAKFQRVVAGA